MKDNKNKNMGDYIHALMRCNNSDEYMVIRQQTNDGILEIIKTMGGMNWARIKPLEDDYQEFLEWFKTIEIK